MSLAELLHLGRKEAAKEPEISHPVDKPEDKLQAIASDPGLRQKELDLLNEQLVAQSTEMSREQAKREQEQQASQKRELEEAAEQVAALAKRRRETGVALSFATWQNSEEVWYKSADPNTAYPSVYVSDVPVDYSAEKIGELHRTLGLNPEVIVGLKFLPLTKASVGCNGVLQTGSVLLRYGSDEAAEAVVSRMKGHPIRLSSGEKKYLGARHAAPASWMKDRSQEKKRPAHSNRMAAGSGAHMHGFDAFPPAPPAPATNGPEQEWMSEQPSGKNVFYPKETREAAAEVQDFASKPNGHAETWEPASEGDFSEQHRLAQRHEQWEPASVAQTFQVQGQGGQWGGWPQQAACSWPLAPPWGMAAANGHAMGTAATGIDMDEI